MVETSSTESSNHSSIPSLAKEGKLYTIVIFEAESAENVKEIAERMDSGIVALPPFTLPSKPPGHRCRESVEQEFPIGIRD